MQRFLQIDFLRAAAILGVIAIHVLYYNLTSKITLETRLWDYLHFVVTAFVFSSGYVLAGKTDILQTIRGVFQWYKKRLFRLILPYYLYLIIHTLLIFFLPNLFSGLGVKANYDYFLKALLFSGSVNVAWLPLLFTQLTLLFPLLMLLARKKMLFLYIGFALLATLLITIKPFPIHYSWYMGIPWSLIIVLAFYSFRKPLLLQTLFASGSIFALLLVLWNLLNRKLLIFDNEYPPNFYHLSYGIFLTMIVLYLSKLPVFSRKTAVAIYGYISKNSYSLYFIHYIVLDCMVSLRKVIGHQGAALEFMEVVGISLLISFCLNKVQKVVK